MMDKFLKRDVFACLFGSNATLAIVNIMEGKYALAFIDFLASVCCIYCYRKLDKKG